MLARFLEELDIEKMPHQDVKMISPLKLAYIGDVVYDLLIKSMVLHKSGKAVKFLNKSAVKYVKATSQAYATRLLEEELTEDEIRIIKRGRNQKGISAPKNTSLADYKLATGFEALIGYLYLLEDMDRIFYIVKKTVLLIDNKVEVK